MTSDMTSIWCPRPSKELFVHASLNWIWIEKCFPLVDPDLEAVLNVSPGQMTKDLFGHLRAIFDEGGQQVEVKTFCRGCKRSGQWIGRGGALKYLYIINTYNYPPQLNDLLLYFTCFCFLFLLGFCCRPISELIFRFIFLEDEIDLEVSQQDWPGS